MAGNKRTSAEWAELIARQRASGQTLKAWCAENGINVYTMTDRISRLRKAGYMDNPSELTKTGYIDKTSELTKAEHIDRRMKILQAGHADKRTNTAQAGRVDKRAQPVAGAAWLELAESSAMPVAVQEIQVRVNGFTIVVPKDFCEEPFLRVCKALMSIC